MELSHKTLAPIKHPIYVVNQMGKEGIEWLKEHQNRFILLTDQEEEFISMVKDRSLDRFAKFQYQNATLYYKEMHPARTMVFLGEFHQDFLTSMTNVVCAEGVVIVKSKQLPVRFGRWECVEKMEKGYYQIGRYQYQK